MHTSAFLAQSPHAHLSNSTEHKKNLREFLHYAKNVLPSIASTKKNIWPIHHDHCFMRVILDNIVGCAWYEVIPSPAYKNLTDKQASAALNLARQIATERVSLHALNQRSKQWRDKQLKLEF
ncbi:hypothetical protein [Alteromonas sp. S015]|uniref:hypothetical protein n=1 Tax=Alteromonas sp. S015 TaxID=3117401 RepID=UPI002FE0B66E